MAGRWRWLRVELVDGWPGLWRLWQAGWLHGLAIAVAFSMLLNATLLATFAWPEWGTERVKVALLTMSITAWIAGWLDSRYVRRRWQRQSKRDPQLDLFLAARGEYLKRNWASAEGMLHELLHESPEDVEARLMLATLLRHRGELDAAKEQLRQLQRWSRAAAWNLEIRQEWERLLKLECASERGGDSAEKAGTTEGGEPAAAA